MTRNQRNYLQLLHKLYDKLKSGATVDGTIELTNASVTFDPYDDLNIEGFIPQDNEYIQRELKWYMDQDLDIAVLDDVKIWTQVCDENRKINSNYGFLILSGQNGHQYKSAFNELKRNPYSRRAIMYYTNPWMHYQGGKDHVCTIAVQFYIRNNALQCTVMMRSNDIVFGMRNDLPWHQNILQKLYIDLKNDPEYKNSSLKLGNIHWFATSLHIYERHYKALEKLGKEYGW